MATNDSSDNWDITGFKLFSIHSEGKWNFYTNVPKLSSASQDGYEITASSQWDNAHAAFYAFDGTASTRWASNGTGTQWVQVKFPTATLCNRALITNRSDGCLNQSPTAFEIQASNDAENWNTLLSATTSWSSLGESQTFDFLSNETAYLYYRIVITANSGSGDAHALGEFSLGIIKYEYRRWLHKYDSLVPTMSSNSQDGYVASASSTFGGTTHPAYRAFDNSSNVDNKWLSVANDIRNAWLKIELPTAKVANAFLIQVPAERYTERSPKNFQIQGSNDNSTWTTLVTASELSWSNNQARTFNCENYTAYKFYRIYITASNGGDVVHIGEWKLYKDYYVTEY